MATFPIEDIRNIVFVGHSGAGKTSLGEALLHKTGATNRLGSVVDKTSTFDFADDEKEAIKFVQENSVRDGISRPFRGPPSVKQEVLPDNSKEVGKIIERVKRGTGQLAHQPLLPPPGAEAKKSSNAGMRMAFVPETMTGVINAMSRDWVADNHVDHILPYKGLSDPPKNQGQQQQGKKGNNQNRNNQNNQGNQSNDRSESRD